jgi:stage II sporulation protein AA (anti-sigma F factor antagonist)
LSGELDIATAPALEKLLAWLNAATMNVRLDLSKLAFMDSTGLQLLTRAINHARAHGCQLEVEPDLSPQVRRLFDLVQATPLILREERTAARTQSA